MPQSPTNRHRVLAALNGERVCPVPVGAVTQTATLAQMQELDTWWPDAHFHPESLARLASGARSILGFDMVHVPFDQTIEAELLGATIDYGDRHTNSAVSSHPLSVDAPPPKIPDMYNGRAKAVVGAIGSLRKQLGDDAAVIGGVVGPFTLYSQLLGTSDALVESLLRPARVLRHLEFTTRLVAEYARLQVEAGADAICVGDMAASLDLTSPALYEQIALGAQQELTASIDVPVILHICGTNTKILGMMMRSGAAALSLEARTDLSAAVQAEGSAVVGGVPTIEVLLDGTPEDVSRASAACLDAGVHILAPGCGIPPRTPTENLLEMANTARSRVNDPG